MDRMRKLLFGSTSNSHIQSAGNTFAAIWQRCVSTEVSQQAAILAAMSEVRVKVTEHEAETCKRPR